MNSGGGRALSGWNICQLPPRGWVGPEGTLPVRVQALTGKKLAKNDQNLVKIAKIYDFLREKIGRWAATVGVVGRIALLHCDDCYTCYTLFVICYTATLTTATLATLLHLLHCYTDVLHCYTDDYYTCYTQLVIATLATLTIATLNSSLLHLLHWRNSSFATLINMDSI